MHTQPAIPAGAPARGKRMKTLTHRGLARIAKQALVFDTPAGRIEFVKVDAALGHPYRLVFKGQLYKSWWKEASASMASLALLRAADKAAAQRDYYHYDSGIVPDFANLTLDFNGINQP